MFTAAAARHADLPIEVAQQFTHTEPAAPLGAAGSKCKVMSDSLMRVALAGAVLLVSASRMDAQGAPPPSGLVNQARMSAPSFPIKVPADTDTVSVRPRPTATKYSDAYDTRLTIHRIGSYTMLPLFGAEYVFGQQLLTGGYANWVKPAHTVAAGGIGILFAVNTVTGVWNLTESWNDPAGRTRRLIHSALMIASDAGMVWTGAIAGASKHSQVAAIRHRKVAIGSMGLSTIGAAMMWFWRN